MACNGVAPDAAAPVDDEETEELEVVSTVADEELAELLGASDPVVIG